MLTLEASPPQRQSRGVFSVCYFHPIASDLCTAASSQEFHKHPRVSLGSFIHLPKTDMVHLAEIC